MDALKCTCGCDVYWHGQHVIVHYTCTHYLHKQIKFNCERQFVGEYLNLSAFKYIDIIEARCYGFQMISSDNEQSRSRQME